MNDYEQRTIPVEGGAYEKRYLFMGFKDFLSKAASSAEEMRKKYAPQVLNPEKRYARGIISVTALLAMADGVLEESEVETASKFLQGIEEIQKYLGETAALELFSLLVNELEAESKKGKAFFKLYINKMISEIKQTVTKPEWRSSIMVIATEMASSNTEGKVGQEEQAILDQLKASLEA
jgi:tellurite resistance protein